MALIVSQSQIALAVEDATHVGEARRRAASLIAASAFDERERAHIALAVTEIGTNILKHAGRGRMALRLEERDGGALLEVLALDAGPGMDFATSRRDGHSTTGSLGTGLGALERVASEFDVYTRSGAGTAVRLVFRTPGFQEAAPGLGAICAAKLDEKIPGDGWALRTDEDAMTVVAVDGLGHGPQAAGATQAALAELERGPDLAPAEIISGMHGALANTRGAAIGIAQIDTRRAAGRYAGIGNIAAAVVERGSVHRLVSMNGIVGHTMGRVREFDFSFAPGALLLMHTDGLGTHWNVAAYPGLLEHHPALVAGVLWRDFDRGRDDVTLVALRTGGTP